MSLYSSVYWTKRFLIVFSVFLIIIFTYNTIHFLGSRLSKSEIDSNSIQPEQGFIDINPLTILPINTNLIPENFIDSTTQGNLYVNQEYPSSTNQKPFINVYKIEQKESNISTTETPKLIAENFGFNPNNFTKLSNQSFLWNKGSKSIEINGLYTLIDYENKSVFTEKFSQLSASDTNKNYLVDLISPTQTELKQEFENILSEFEIESSLDNYEFALTRMDYDAEQDKFNRLPSTAESDFIRIDAFRQYISLNKDSTSSSTITKAAYPNYLNSNNYIILPAKSTSKDYIDSLVKLSLYNWPVNQDEEDLENANNVQTYYLKSPTEAYNELVKEKKYLVQVLDWDTNADIDLSLIEPFTDIDIISIDLEFFENKVNTKYIQPVYVFNCQLFQNTSKYRFVYYVPAVQLQNNTGN